MIHSPGASPSPLCGGLRPTPSLISPASFCRKTWMFQSSGTPLLFLGILLHYPCPKSLVFTVVIIFNGRWYLFFLAFGSSFSLQCTVYLSTTCLYRVPLKFVYALIWCGLSVTSLHPSARSVSSILTTEMLQSCCITSFHFRGCRMRAASITLGLVSSNTLHMYQLCALI